MLFLVENESFVDHLVNLDRVGHLVKDHVPVQRQHSFHLTVNSVAALVELLQRFDFIDANEGEEVCGEDCV